MRTIFPTKYAPFEGPDWAEVEIVDQEAAHQQRWEMLAEWCWNRDIFLACDIRFGKRTKVHA
jgi:hypothetical protein